jgi:lysophospholipase L1-like esterase
MSRRDRIRAALRRLAPVGLVVLSSVVAVLLGEGASRLLVNPADLLSLEPLDDPILGVRIEPRVAGHDALGFRNHSVPARADIVVIGDSVTYGVSATSQASWPKQLGAILGEEVYNMGLLGYGPLQYLHLAQSTAKTLRPRLMIVGFYFGNDLMDAYYLAHGRAHWHAWRVSSRAEEGTTAFDIAGQAERRKRFADLREWLSRNSVLYSLLRVTLFARLAGREQEELARRSPRDQRMLWSDPVNPAVRTIFTPRLRLSAVDLSIAAVREGMAISRKALGALKVETERQGVPLLIVLLPTKERVYCGHLRASGAQLPEAFVELCAAEARTSGELAEFLRERGIAYVDAAPALEARVRQRVPIYPTDTDGHPQAGGYRAIAEEVAAAVRRRYPRN